MSGKGKSSICRCDGTCALWQRCNAQLYRLRDLADAQDLSVVLKLPREFAEELDESVRAEYWKLWDAAQSASEKQE